MPSDAEYLSAVEAGDTAKAQELVDQAAKAAGYNVGPVWHETASQFNAFEVSPRGAVFFGFSPERAKQGAKAGAVDSYRSGTGRSIRAFIKAKAIDGISLTEREKDTFSKLPDSINTMDELKQLQQIYPQDANWIRGAYNQEGKKLDSPPVANLDQVVKTGRGLIFGKNIPDYYGLSDEISRHESLIRQGYDAGLLADEAGISLAVFDPRNIKSADPITRDDAGNVIPLSQRFQQSSADIRYMPAPVPDPSIPGAYSMSGYRILPGKTKGKLRVYSPSGSLVGVVGSVDDAQRMIQKKLQ